MQVSAWMPAGVWAAEEDKRLLLMVGVSLLLHVGVLWLWKSPRSNGSITISAMTVLLPQHVEAPRSIPPLPTQPPSPPVVAKPELHTPVVIPLPRIAPKLTPAVSSAPAPALPAQDRISAANEGVKVVLRLNAEGGVTQIFWDRLPALSDEQFRNLERNVRARHYGSHVSDRSITEVIDVRALLSLPPAQTDAFNSVSPAPTGESGTTNPP